jgi:hypothetical protein
LVKVFTVPGETDVTVVPPAAKEPNKLDELIFIEISCELPEYVSVVVVAPIPEIGVNVNLIVFATAPLASPVIIVLIGQEVGLRQIVGCNELNIIL